MEIILQVVPAKGIETFFGMLRLQSVCHVQTTLSFRGPECWKDEMRRPVIKSTAHSPILSWVITRLISSKSTLWTHHRSPVRARYSYHVSFVNSNSDWGSAPVGNIHSISNRETSHFRLTQQVDYFFVSLALSPIIRTPWRIGSH